MTTKVTRNMLNTSIDDNGNATALTIGSNEKVGLGTTSTDHQLTVNAVAFDGLQLQSAGSDCGYLGVYTDTVYVGAGSNLIFHTGNAGVTDGTERMRIDSSGNVLIGKTAYDNDNVGVALHPTSSSWFTASDNYPLGVNRKGSDGTLIQFTNDQAGCGTITCSGTSTNYGSGSDYRMKENIQVMEKGLERVNKLNPVKFTWKGEFGGGESEGFIAHEIQEAGWNEGVVGKKDGQEMQVMDYGKLTPLLVKAIQEQQEQIESLQQEIEVLKNGN